MKWHAKPSPADDRGKAVNIRGYVQSTGELKDWIDPMQFLSCR